MTDLNWGSGDVYEAAALGEYENPGFYSEKYLRDAESDPEPHGEKSRVCGECGNKFPTDVEYCPNHKEPEIKVEKARVFGVWYGGPSYSYGCITDDLEGFNFLEDAKTALLDRYSVGHWQKMYFGYVNKESSSDLTPAVGEDCEMLIYWGDPTDWEDAHPAQRLYLSFGSDDEAIVVTENL